jgi:hypothetical protein
MNCQIEFANDDVGTPCGKRAVAHRMKRIDKGLILKALCALDNP